MTMTTQQMTTIVNLATWLSSLPTDPQDKALLSMDPILATTTLRQDTVYALTGNMLGDGSLRQKVKNGEPRGNVLFEMTKGPAAFEQVTETYNAYYKELSRTGFRETTFMSSIHKKIITQYHIFTRALPALTCLHRLWYVWNPDLGKYIKVVPKDIHLMFSPLSLAHWIMDDGYYTDKTLILCTDNFSKDDCIRLQALLAQYSILTGLIVQKGKYRIRVYQGSLSTVINLVRPHLHKDFVYKLGILSSDTPFNEYKIQT